MCIGRTQTPAPLGNTVTAGAQHWSSAQEHQLTIAWLSRQVTEAFPWDTSPRYLLRDRDASYGVAFRSRVEAMGITEVITAPHSPWQNIYVERVIGSIVRECLDHLVIFSERHLRRVMSSYIVCKRFTSLHFNSAFRQNQHFATDAIRYPPTRASAATWQRFPS